MLWSDMVELKAMLEIEPDDRAEDVRLGFWLKLACGMLEEYLGYPIYRTTRTEYYKGSGTQKLILNVRPAYADSFLAVAVDEQGRFGVPAGSFDAHTAPLTYGTDFGLWLDSARDATRSDRAILVRHSGLWNKAAVRQVGLLSPFVAESPGTIRVTYTGGFYAEELPPNFVLAAVQTVARLRFMMPLGLPVTGDGYQGVSVGIALGEKNWLIGQCKHLLFGKRHRKF